MAVRVLSGGAAKGIVSALEAEFSAETGAAIDGTFSAVGAMKDRVLAGEVCDVLILTEAVIEDLDGRGLLIPGSRAALGSVRTGIAVPAGFPAPDIATAAAFADTVRAARGIYVPDPVRSTAGVYFVGVLEALGVGREAAPLMRAFPNGETAMLRLAQDRGPGTFGCTQMTEIRMTPGLTLVGPLPERHDLSTVYTAAVSARSRVLDLAARLVALLTGPAARQRRIDCGFEAGSDGRLARP